MNCSPRLWDDVEEGLGVEQPDGPTQEVVVVPLDRPNLDEQVEALLDRLPTRFAIGGLSLGAIVAMAVHRRAPARVAGLFLVATNSRAPTRCTALDVEGPAPRLAAGATPRELQEELVRCSSARTRRRGFASALWRWPTKSVQRTWWLSSSFS